MYEYEVTDLSIRRRLIKIRYFEYSGSVISNVETCDRVIQNMK
jgi:hypothetical protein